MYARTRHTTLLARRPFWIRIYIYIFIYVYLPDPGSAVWSGGKKNGSSSAVLETIIIVIIIIVIFAKYTVIVPVVRLLRPSPRPSAVINRQKVALTNTPRSRSVCRTFLAGAYGRHVTEQYLFVYIFMGRVLHERFAGNPLFVRNQRKSH